MDSIIVQVFIGLGFFFFLFDLFYIITYKKKKGNKKRDKNSNKKTLNLLRVVTICGILAMNTFLIICCIYIFLYDILKMFIPGFVLNPYFQIVGFIIILFGDTLLFISYKELGSSWAYPIDKWGKKLTLVTSGIYSKIRHPIYLSFNILSIGFILLIQDWLLVVLYLLGAIGLYLQALSEEQILTKHFGDIYINYTKKTGRFVLHVRKN